MRGGRHEKTVWELRMAVELRIWYLRFFVCVCLTNTHKKGDIRFCVNVDSVCERTFVSLCLFVCMCVFMCVVLCASGDAPSKSGPLQGVIHDFITQALD